MLQNPRKRLSYFLTLELFHLSIKFSYYKNNNLEITLWTKLKHKTRQENFIFNILRPVSQNIGNMYSSLTNQVAYTFLCANDRQVWILHCCFIGIHSSLRLESRSHSNYSTVWDCLIDLNNKIPLTNSYYVQSWTFALLQQNNIILKVN